MTVIRTSDRKTFKTCRQQWEFTSKIRQNWEPNKEARNLKFGTAIHAALKTYYEPSTWTVDRNAIAPLAIASFVEKYPLDKDAAIDEEGQWKEDIALGKGMLLHYFEWSSTMDQFTPLHVEIEFEVGIPCLTDNENFQFVIHDDGDYYLHTLDGNPIVYQGRLDMLVEDYYNKYWIVDHKTASRFDTTDHLNLDEQCGSYAWAIQQQLGVQIEGVIYNELLKDVPHSPKVLKSGELSKDKSQNTTYNLYLTAVREGGYDPAAYAEILDHFKSQGNKFFRRTQVHRSQRELEILGEHIALEAMDMLDPNLSIYPNPSRFTCNMCAFKAPCLSKMEGSDYNWILNDNYHVR